MILPGDMIDCQDPIVWDHPLNLGRICWFLSTPDQFNATEWTDLTGRYKFSKLDFGGGNFGVWRTISPRDGWDTGGFLCRLGGLRLDGSNVSGHPFKPTDNFTVIFWFNNTNAGGGVSKILGSWGGSADGNWYVQSGASSGTTAYRRFTFGGNSAIITNPVYANDNQWYMMALVASGGTTSLYISSEESSGSNGARITPYLEASGSTTYSGTGTNYIQAGDDSAGSFCAIDDFSIWTRPLSLSEISAYYNESRTGYRNTLRRSKWLVLIPPEIRLTAASSIGYSSSATPVDGFPAVRGSSGLGLSSSVPRPIYDRALGGSNNTTFSSVVPRPVYIRALTAGDTLGLSPKSEQTIFEFRNLSASSGLVYAGGSVVVPFLRNLFSSSSFGLSSASPVPGHEVPVTASSRIGLSVRAVFPQSRSVDAGNIFYLWPQATWYKSPLRLSASGSLAFNNATPNFAGSPTTPTQVTIGSKILSASGRLGFNNHTPDLIGKPRTPTQVTIGFKLLSASGSLRIGDLIRATQYTTGFKLLSAASGFRFNDRTPDVLGFPTTPTQVTVGSKALSAFGGFGLNNHSPDVLGHPTTPTLSTVGFKLLAAASRLGLSNNTPNLLGYPTTPTQVTVGAKSVSAFGGFGVSGRTPTLSVVGFKNLVAGSSLSLFCRSLGVGSGNRSVVGSSGLSLSSRSSVFSFGPKLLSASSKINLSQLSYCVFLRSYSLRSSSYWSISGVGRVAFERKLQAISSLRLGGLSSRAKRDLLLVSSSRLSVSGSGSDSSVRLVGADSIALRGVASLVYQEVGFHASNSLGLNGASWCAQVLPWRRAPLTFVPGGNLPHS